MPKPLMAQIAELEGFVGELEQDRLELVEAIIAQSSNGYNVADLEKLALHGNAIQSVKDAIAFCKTSSGE